MTPPPRLRAAAGALVVAGVVAAAAFRLAAGHSLPFWLVLLVSVLSLAAGASVFGADAMRLGTAIFRREQ
ncbi:MAG: hypothetical protein V5A23_05560 [Halobacteriales archaeon]